MIRRVIIYSVFLLSFQVTLSQHYDIGYNTEYQKIMVPYMESQVDNTKFKIIDFIINDKKKIKKIFNKCAGCTDEFTCNFPNHKILEELVFIDNVLVSGIEYFIHPKFPFLSIPRHFQIQEIEREVANYQNIKFTASLIKYLPKMQKGIFKVRVYQETDQKSFYILETAQGSKIYFQQ